jgi:hypothetical protein
MDCPARGSAFTFDIDPERPLSTSLSDAVPGADEDDRIEVRFDDTFIVVSSIEETIATSNLE